jgi:hypothetical protein
MLSEDFSLTSASEDFFDVTHMIGIQDRDRYTGAITVVSKFLNPNLKYYTPRVNHQVEFTIHKFWSMHMILIYCEAAICG